MSVNENEIDWECIKKLRKKTKAGPGKPSRKVGDIVRVGCFVGRVEKFDMYGTFPGYDVRVLLPNGLGTAIVEVVEYKNGSLVPDDPYQIIDIMQRIEGDPPMRLVRSDP